MFSFDFIQKYHPLEKMEIPGYKVVSTFCPKMSFDFKLWVGFNIKQILELAKHFNIDIKQEYDLFSQWPESVILEDFTNYKNDNKLQDWFKHTCWQSFDEKDNDYLLKCVNYYYNIEALLRGLMLNVYAIYVDNLQVLIPIIYEKEVYNLNSDYAQVLLIPGVSYLSMQTPYTILYGVLIEYAYIFLNENVDDYYALLNSGLNKKYNNTHDLKNFDTIYLASKHYTDKIKSFQRLLNQNQDLGNQNLKIKEQVEKVEVKKEEANNQTESTKNKNASKDIPQKPQGFLSSFIQWGKSAIESIRNYYKPIAIGTAVIGSALVYKLWQAKKNNIAQKS